MKLGIYKHFKGKLYKVLGLVKHSETLEDLVLYECLYENKKSKIWVRPLTNFQEYVLINGQKVKRFEYLHEHQ